MVASNNTLIFGDGYSKYLGCTIPLVNDRRVMRPVNSAELKSSITSYWGTGLFLDNDDKPVDTLRLNYFSLDVKEIECKSINNHKPENVKAFIVLSDYISKDVIKSNIYNINKELKKKYSDTDFVFYFPK